jgi:diguanylate cyclase (GGDEF)-like protein
LDARRRVLDKSGHDFILFDQAFTVVRSRWKPAHLLRTPQGFHAKVGLHPAGGTALQFLHIRSGPHFMQVVCGFTAICGVATVAATWFATAGWPPEYHRKAMLLALSLSTIIGSLSVFTMADAIRSVIQTRDKLADQASHDELTGLANRREFNLQSNRLIALALRQRAPLSVLMIDVDLLKVVNDRRGHEAGDTALTDFAQELEGELRCTDVVARIGGDEFAVFLYGADAHAAGLVAERIRAAIESAGIDVTASIGAAEIDPGSGLAEAMKRADSALYRAKAAGRNRVRIAFPISLDPRPARVADRTAA